MPKSIKKHLFTDKEATALILLRHGITLWNELGRIQGRLDSPLSPAGRAQVHEWGKFLGSLGIQRIIASDLGRVRETVAILTEQLPEVPIVWNPELQEQSWGSWEGISLEELRHSHEQELHAGVRAGWDFRPPQGESRRELLERSLGVIKDAVQRWPGQRLLVVCHEGVIKTLIYHLEGRAFLPEEKKILQKRQIHLLLGKGESLRVGALNIFPQPKTTLGTRK